MCNGSVETITSSYSLKLHSSWIAASGSGSPTLASSTFRPSTRNSSTNAARCCSASSPPPCMSAAQPSPCGVEGITSVNEQGPCMVLVRRASKSSGDSAVRFATTRTRASLIERAYRLHSPSSMRMWRAVLRRIAGCALVALAFAGQALLPASSSADVGPGDWGIADDFHVPSLSLNASFDELAPKSYRMIAAWDQLGDPGYRSQIQAKIDEANAAARGPGGMEIAVSFSVPPQTWQGVALTGQAWMDQVAPFIDRFAADVEWWSPVNEPGLKGWTFTPSGASMVADFSVRLKSYLEQSHPADKLLSPDFNDHYNSDGTLKRHPDGTSFVERYVKLFDRAGGQFGSAVAWHPYGGVRRTSFLSTDDMVATLSATSGAGLPIWVTEAGARADDSSTASQTEAQQDAQVKWMTDTSAGLASHDGITRLHYYNMREE